MSGFDPDYTEMSVMKTNENLANIFACFNFSMYIQYISVRCSLPSVGRWNILNIGLNGNIGAGIELCNM